MRAFGHVFLNGPRFTLGLNPRASVLTQARPGRREEISHNRDARTDSARIAIRSKVGRLCLCLVGFLFTLAQPHAHALDPTRLISQYGHTIWFIEDGKVRRDSPIAQTPDGYIWLRDPNQRGLLRFDGTQFVTWNPPNNATFWPIIALLGAQDGSLWIGTSHGLDRLKNGQLSTITKPTDSFGVNFMMEDHAGRIWVTRYHVPKGEGGLCEVEGDNLHCYGPSDGVPAGYGLGLAQDAAGHVWFATKQSIREWKPGTPATEYLDSVKHPQIVNVAVDHSGNIWATMNEVGPKFGVRYFHNGVWGEYVAAGFRSSTVRSNALLVDKAGAVWIGTQNDGLYRVWKDHVDHFSERDGLTGNEVAWIYEDHEGNLWVSTNEGIDLFRDRPVITYSLNQGLSSNSVQTVLAASDGTVWAGETEGVGWSGDHRADILRLGAGMRFTPGPKLPGRIGAMLQDHSGAIWLSLESEMVVYDHGKVEKVIPRTGLTFDDTVSAMLEDFTGEVFALTKFTLYRIKGRVFQEAIPIAAYPNTTGYLALNPDGGMWIATLERLMLYRNGIIQTYPLPDHAESVHITGLFADGADPLLLTTSAGLWRWNGKQWQVLNDTNGLPCNVLAAAIKDRHGSLWLQARCGLLSVETGELEKWRRDPGSRPSITVLDSLDGVRAGVNWTLKPTMSLAPDGKIWFSNGRVIQAIDPDHIYRNPLAPPVHVEQLIADDRTFQPVPQPRLPPNPRNLEIDYTALSLSAPKKVLFRYFLEGHDKSWQGPVTRRQAFYTDLPPRTYRFHVVACNNSGVWNDTGAVAEFVVEPTYYQTAWFKALLAIAVVGVLWALYLLRLKQATANVQERLLAQMEERERIARELHDTLLQGFQGITLRVQGVAKNMPAQDPLRKMMDDVLDRADGVLREARQRVRNLRRRTADENDLADRLTKCGEELSKDHAATFTLAIVGEPKILESTVQDEAYRIAGEALTNAFRHASASRIETEVTYDPSALRIRVRDDGVGMDKAVAANGHSGHFGLTGMRERARAIRAELNIWSRDAAGTEVELVIPASIAYPRGEKAS